MQMMQLERKPPVVVVQGLQLLWLVLKLAGKLKLAHRTDFGTEPCQASFSLLGSWREVWVTASVPMVDLGPDVLRPCEKNKISTILITPAF